MRLNAAHGMNPVGFPDDDPVKRGSRDYGLKVWGGIDTPIPAVRESRAEQVVICSSKIPEDRARDICMACREIGVTCSRMSFSFTETLSDHRSEAPALELVDL
jgi:FlaA1/EpsC-like NDP-sugar epimerase